MKQLGNNSLTIVVLFFRTLPMKIIEYLPKFERSAMLVRHLTHATSLMSWINQQAIDVSWITKCQKDSLIRQTHFSTACDFLTFYFL